MQRRFFFSTLWAIILILVGVLLILSNLGVIQINVWGLVWPLLLLGAGVWILWNALAQRAGPETQEAVVRLEGASRGRVHVRHGAGRLAVAAGSAPDVLLAGTFAGGVDCQTNREGDLLAVDLRVPQGEALWARPWNWGPAGALHWRLELNRDVPLALRFDTGAGEATIDLTDLRVGDVVLKTGASSTTLRLPANAGNTRVSIEGGAAAVSIHVPQGVAARVDAQGGLAGISVDRERFPRSGNLYQSADFDGAVNRVEIKAQIGVGTVDVR